eukprot:gene2435-4725_t
MNKRLAEDQLDSRDEWQQLYSKTQDSVYWYNSRTHKSSWTNPVDGNMTSSESSIEKAVETTGDWVEHFSKSKGQPYWFNMTTGKSVWINPSTADVTIPLTESITEILDRERSQIYVNAPTFPRQESCTNVASLIEKLRRDKAKVIQAPISSKRSGIDFVKTTFEQMLKTRLKVKKGNVAVDLPSFWEVWFQPDGALKRDILESKDPNEAKWYLQRTHGYKLATNFMPGYAKAIFEYFQASTVLDPCAGWGDRLTGALGTTSPPVTRYVAFDPNRTLRPGYVTLSNRFGIGLTRLTTEEMVFDNGFEIRSKPFEIGSLALRDNSFDLVFTSPPFFDYEMYNPNNPEYHDWIKEFYIPLMQQAHRCVKPGKFVAIYIGDTSAGEIDDFMRNQVEKITPLIKSDQIGFRGLASDKVRGIWVYQKPS